MLTSIHGWRLTNRRSPGSFPGLDRSRCRFSVDKGVHPCLLYWNRRTVQRKLPFAALRRFPWALAARSRFKAQLLPCSVRERAHVHAVDGTCPHRGAPLADGILAGDKVVCPFHAMRFELASGKCDRPEICPIHVHSTRVSDGWIMLTVADRS